MPVLLAISRHLFNNNMVITTQTAERPYKMLRELQTDYGIQVKYSIWFNEWIPFLRYFCFTNYIYYENIESKGLLPFESLNMLGELTKGIRLNAGTSIKKSMKQEMALFVEVGYYKEKVRFVMIQDIFIPKFLVKNLKVIALSIKY